MSFFDIGRYRTDEYAKRKLQDENKLLQEEIEMRRYRERRDDYEREQQNHREQERLEQDRKNERELRFNLYEEKKELRDELEDLKLRRKFGIEEERVNAV